MALAVSAGFILLLAPMHSAIWPATAQQEADTNQSSNRVERFSISGKSAQAIWSMENEDESHTDVFIAIVDSASKADEQFTESYLFITITEYELVEVCEQYYGQEYCYYDYDWLMEFFGYTALDKAAFEISDSLRSASVQDLELGGFDYVSQNEMTITIDADWTGVGDTTRTRDFYSDSGESFKFTFKSMGVSRDADATLNITGDIEISTDNSIDAEASLSKIREGTLLRFTGKPDSENPPGHGGNPDQTNSWKSLVGPIEELQDNLAEFEEQIESLEERIAELEEQIDGGGSSGQNIIIELDSIDYEAGDDVVVTGVIDENILEPEENSVSIEVIDPVEDTEEEDLELDDDGEFELDYELADNAGDGLYTVHVEYLDVEAFSYFIVDEEDNEIEVETDDDSYQAGDTVEVFGTVVDPITGVDEVEILVLGPNGQVDGDEVELDADEFEFEFELPDDITGRYAIMVSYDGVQGGEAIIEVKESRPSSEISAELEDSTLNPGDDVIIRGSIDEGDVEVGEEIFLKVIDPDDNDVVSDSIEPEFDGSFVFEFTLDDDAVTGTYEAILEYPGYSDKELTFTVTS
jgi:hypothetical protein